MSNRTVTIPGGTWVELTEGDTTNMTWVVVEKTVWIRPTIGAVSPADRDGAYPYRKGEGEFDIAIAKLRPGATRVYGYAEATTTVVCSHA